MIEVTDLGTMAYRPAWAVQETVHAQVAGGAPERILLVEHLPVITFGRQNAILWHRENDPNQLPKKVKEFEVPAGRPNLLASEADVAARGVEIVLSDRGGDITFHGPGQLVAYTIIRINDHGLSVGGYVRLLENATIGALRRIGIEARRENGVVGVWTDLGKIAAIGLRVRRGVTLHGLALNVETDLDYFKLIVPCGLGGRKVTSVRKVREALGEKSPSMEEVKGVVVESLREALEAAGTS